MSLIIGQESAPSAPSSGKSILYSDSADARLKIVRADGTRVPLMQAPGRNILTNGSFTYAQRQDPPTLTTYSNTSGRTYGPDRWGITNENASVQFKRVDTAGSQESGLYSRFYGHFKKITNAGKVIVSQAIECSESMPFRGRLVRVQMTARNITGTHTLRLGLLQLTSSGTVDSIPATFVSAFGAVGTDPTWGTNLSAITPERASSTCSVSGAALSCVLSSVWQRFSGTFLIPSTCKNLIVVAFTNGQPADGNEFGVSEFGFHEGEEERDLSHDAADSSSRVQRYCSKTFSVDQAPVQNLGSGTGEYRWVASKAGAVAQRTASYLFPVRMRAAPTVTTYNPQAADDKVSDLTSGGSGGTPAVSNISDTALYIQATGNAGTAVGNLIGIHMMLEAEL